jgi:hypothetical protein
MIPIEFHKWGHFGLSIEGSVVLPFCQTYHLTHCDCLSNAKQQRQYFGHLFTIIVFPSDWDVKKRHEPVQYPNKNTNQSKTY